MPISAIVFCRRDEVDKIRTLFEKLQNSNFITIIGDYPFSVILLVPTIIAKILLNSVSTIAQELFNLLQQGKDVLVLSLRLNERCSRLLNKIKLRILKTMFKIMSIFVPEAKPYLEHLNMIVLKGDKLSAIVDSLHNVSNIGNLGLSTNVSISLNVTDDTVNNVGVKDFIEQIKSYLQFADYRLLKFPCVGLIGTFVNVGSLVALTSLGVPVHVAGALAIELSVLNNFTLHELWTFRRKRVSRKFRDIVVRYFKFNFACLLGIIVNYAMLLLLHAMFGVQYALADLIGIVCGSIVNYLFSDNFVWSVKKITGR